jgi:hypothetical protein
MQHRRSDRGRVAGIGQGRHGVRRRADQNARYAIVCLQLAARRSALKRAKAARLRLRSSILILGTCGTPDYFRESPPLQSRHPARERTLRLHPVVFWPGASACRPSAHHPTVRHAQLYSKRALAVKMRPCRARYVMPLAVKVCAKCGETMPSDCA